MMWRLLLTLVVGLYIGNQYMKQPARYVVINPDTTSYQFLRNKIPDLKQPVAVTEKRKIIAIIDTGVDLEHKDLKSFVCDGGHRDFVGSGIFDTHGHGTHIAGLITKGLDPSKVCFISLKFYSDKTGNTNLSNEMQAIRWAIDQGASLINLSAGGDYQVTAETKLVMEAVQKRILFVTSAGNNGQDLSKDCSYYPACAVKGNYMFVVGSLNRFGRPATSSNYGGPVINWAPGLEQVSTLPDNQYGAMSGTSQATANFSNRLLGGKGESFEAKRSK